MTVRGFALRGAIWLLTAVIPAASGASPSLSELTGQAASLLRSGKSAAAQVMLEQATASYPRSAEAWAMLGSAYSQQGRDGDAVGAYRRAVQLDPESTSELFNLGILYLRQSNYSGAAAALGRFCHSHPNDATALVAYAHALLLSDRKTEAAEAAGRSAQSATTPEQALQAAQILLQTSQPAETVGFLKSATAKWPACNDCITLLARAEYQAKDYAAVVALLDKPQPPSDASAALLLASALGETGRDHQAIDVLEAAVSSFRGEKPLYLLLAQAYSATGLRQEAARVIGEAKQRWPNDTQVRDVAAALAAASEPAAETVGRLAAAPVARLDRLERSQLLQAYIELQQYAQAGQLAGALLALGDPSESTVIADANLLQTQQRDDEAVALLEKWRSRFGDSSAYLFTLGLSQFDLGRYAAARELLKASVKKRPDLHQAYFLLGHCLASEGSPQEALPYYKKALALAPQKALYQYHVGLLLQQLDTPQTAELYLKRAVDLNGSFHAARYQLAKAYFDTDRAGLALEQLLAAVQLDPSNESAYYLLGRVQSRLGHAAEAKAALAQLRRIQAGNRRQRQQVEAAYAGGKVAP